MAYRFRKRLEAVLFSLTALGEQHWPVISFLLVMQWFSRPFWIQLLSRPLWAELLSRPLWAQLLYHSCNWICSRCGKVQHKDDRNQGRGYKVAGRSLDRGGNYSTLKRGDLYFVAVLTDGNSRCRCVHNSFSAGTVEYNHHPELPYQTNLCERQLSNQSRNGVLTFNIRSSVVILTRQV